MNKFNHVSIEECSEQLSKRFDYTPLNWYGIYGKLIIDVMSLWTTFCNCFFKAPHPSLNWPEEILPNQLEKFLLQIEFTFEIHIFEHSVYHWKSCTFETVSQFVIYLLSTQTSLRYLWDSILFLWINYWNCLEQNWHFTVKHFDGTKWFHLN